VAASGDIERALRAPPELVREILGSSAGARECA